MKFSCSQSSLAEAVSIVERAVSKTKVLATDGMIYAHVHNDELFLAAKNQALFIQTAIPVEQSESGAVLIDGRFFGPIVRKLSSGDVYVRHNAKKNRIEIRGGRANFQVATRPIDDFPSFPKVEGKTVRVEQGVLKQLIEHTYFASAVSDEVATLEGVCIDIETNVLTLVATDRGRLACRSHRLINPADDVRVVIPTDSLREVERLLSSDDGIVEIEISDRLIRFDLGNTQITSQVIAGEYPNFRLVIPKDDPPIQVVLDRSVFLEALERVSLLESDRPAAAEFFASEEGLRITSTEHEVGFVEELVDAKHQGPEGAATYQCRYLIEILKHVKTSEVVRLSISDQKLQSTIRFEGDDDLVYIIMPINRVQPDEEDEEDEVHQEDAA